MNSRPVAFRANGKIIRCTKHTAITLEPIIRNGERTGGFKAPDTIVAMKISVEGLKGDPEDGRCEFWIPHEGGYWYHHYEAVEWAGQFGIAQRRDGRIGGFMVCRKATRGSARVQA